MQRVRPNIPPISIQAYPLTCRFRACGLEHSRSNSQAGVRCDDLDACDPLRQLASLSRRQLSTGVQITCVFVEDSIDFLACAIC
jgi:hypothetical protein